MVGVVYLHVSVASAAACGLAYASFASPAIHFASSAISASDQRVATLRVLAAFANSLAFN